MLKTTVEYAIHICVYIPFLSRIYISTIFLVLLFHVFLLFSEMLADKRIIRSNDTYCIEFFTASCNMLLNCFYLNSITSLKWPCSSTWTHRIPTAIWIRSIFIFRRVRSRRRWWWIRRRFRRWWIWRRWRINDIFILLIIIIVIIKCLKGFLNYHILARFFL